MSTDMLPVGVRRDGSYYTRIHWTDSTVTNPKFWVNNLINDDLDRNGGTWGANTDMKANVILDFFGESQKVKKISLYKNVGEDISILEEIAKNVNIYVSNTDQALSLRGAEDDIESVEWTKVCTFDIKMAVEWQSIVLDEAVDAKYVRMELVDNFCKRDDSFIPWIEMNEIKLYPEA